MEGHSRKCRARAQSHLVGSARGILSHTELWRTNPPSSAPASYLRGSHCLRMGVVQLVQGNTKILLKHWEPSSAKISLHFLAQSVWKTGEEREGKDSGSAPLLALSGWLQPLPSPTSCPVACATSRPGCGYKQPGCCGTTRHRNLPAQNPVNAETNSISSVTDHSSS